MSLAKPLSSLRKTRLRQTFLALAAVAVGAQILFLRPDALEVPGASDAGRPIRREDLRRLILPGGEPLAPGVPEDRVPDYNLEDFHYLSSTSGKKEWKIIADRAHMYTAENLVHAATIRAYLYGDPADLPAPPKGASPTVAPEDAGATVIDAREAKHSTATRDLEMYGNVVAVFPDGFTLRSEYMLYNPKTRNLSIPRAFPVAGESAPEGGKTIRFTSRGMDFAMLTGEIFLPEAVDFEMIRLPQAVSPATATTEAGVPDTTRIISDEARIYRGDKRGEFRMYASRPLATRFVRVAQPRLKVQSREATLYYRELDRRLRYMIAREDVAIKEEGELGDPIRYATAGRADFDTQVNRIFLTRFPQVYQDSDTVTGEVVTIYRDTDIVEVDQSNAFSTGQETDGE
ncbi:MAG: LPS export ABC transporter periplasmic protein LptC [Bdellovibrionales bacterium]|nr:LPS export ABC transporter periplasmic protein LptC [Bdellovibrionales bacterium]